MEHKLIMAVSGFPALYDSSSAAYREPGLRSDAWRRVAESVGVHESECRRRWKTLRDQHRRERQREKERRQSTIGLFNYRPWRFSSILSFLNPFIDARASQANGANGTGGWTLDPQNPHHFHLHTAEGPSDDDDDDGFVADATSSSSSFSDFVLRKRSAGGGGDAPPLKEAKMEPADPEVARYDLQNTAAAAAARLHQQGVLLYHKEEEGEESLRPPRAEGHWGDDVTLFLLSLAPAMRRLGARKQSLLRTKIQQLLHEAEFGPADFT